VKSRSRPFKIMAEQEQEKSQTTIRMPKQLYKDVQHIAIDQETSVNEIVIQLIENFVEETTAETEEEEAEGQAS